MNHDETHARAHEKAIADMTAESYLLGDLSDAEADAFEMHYFDCRVCADTVRAGTAMFAAGRKVAMEAPPVSERVDSGGLRVPEPLPAPLPAPLSFVKRAPQWLSIAASAVLAFFIGQAPWFQPAVALPRMEVADLGGAITGVMRGPEDDKLLIRFEGERPVEVVITNTPPQPLYPAYLVELRDGSGKVLNTASLTAQRALHEDGVPVLLRALPAGRYFLAILGVRKDGNHQELAGKSIVVQ